MAITAEDTQSLCCSHQDSAVHKIQNLTKEPVSFYKSLLSLHLSETIFRDEFSTTHQK